MAQFVLTKTDNTGPDQEIPVKEHEQIDLALDANGGAVDTGEILIKLQDFSGNDISEEYSLAFITVAPGGTDFTFQVYEDFGSGDVLKYEVAQVNTTLTSLTFVIDKQVSFRHPVKLVVVNDGGSPQTYTLTYRLISRQRHAKF